MNHQEQTTPIPALPPHRVDIQKWSIYRYQHNWVSRVFQFLDKHPRHTRYFTPGEEVSFTFEQIPLNVFSGWQNEMPRRRSPNAQ